MSLSSAKDYTWLTGDCLVVAPLLLGCELVSQKDGLTTSGIIVEVEAYHGSIDPASHAYRGLTKRNAPMFKEGGTIYTYFTYGMHTCFNIVTGPVGDAQAVLIRALEPYAGVEIMKQRRHTAKSTNLTSGPAKLAQALGISLHDSGTSLGDTIKLVTPKQPLQASSIATGPRIGIKEGTDLLWRFYDPTSPFVSVRDRAST